MTTSNLGRIAVVSQGDWVAGTYKALDIVRYNGSAYIAKVGTSTVPTNTTYWSLLVNDGTPNYTWIKYADDDIGTGLSNTSTGKTYIGIAVNKTTATESTTASDYEWSLIKGDTLYTWIKYADDDIGTGLSDLPTGKSYIGIAVNKTSATESTTAADYAWSLIKGADGAGGTVTSVAALTLGTTGTDVSSTVTNDTTTPVISLNLPNASASARGMLTTTDWSAFNGKQNAITFGTNVLTFIETPTSANLASAITNETGTGSLVFGTTPTLTGFRETKVAMAANAIDLSLGAYFSKTFVAGAVTLTISNVATTGIASSFILDATNMGLATITFWAAIKWAGGTAPTFTTSGRDIVSFYTHDGGTTWNGIVIAKDIR